MRSLLSILLSVLIGLTPAIAWAETVYALTANKRIFQFDSHSKVGGPSVGYFLITGDDSLRSIDFKPGFGPLIGIGPTSLYALPIAAPTITSSSLGSFPSVTGISTSGDFDPVTGCLRIIGNEGDNVRASLFNMDCEGTDSILSFAAGDPNFGVTPHVVAIAHSENAIDATKTTLFGIDSALDVLVTIGGPNGNPSPDSGTVFTVGSLGVDTSESVGFDIGAPDQGIALATLTDASGVSSLYSINLRTGNATKLFQTFQEVLDIAIVPSGAFEFSAESFTVRKSANRVAIGVKRTGGAFGETSLVLSNVPSTTDSARPGEDYVAFNLVLNFEPGEIEKTIMVDLLRNSDVPGDKGFTIGGKAPTHDQSIFSMLTTVNILDDDAPTAAPLDVLSSIRNESLTQLGERKPLLLSVACSRACSFSTQALLPRTFAKRFNLKGVKVGTKVQIAEASGEYDGVNRAEVTLPVKKKLARLLRRSRASVPLTILTVGVDGTETGEDTLVLRLQ